MTGAWLVQHDEHELTIQGAGRKARVFCECGRTAVATAQGLECPTVVFGEATRDG